MRLVDAWKPVDVRQRGCLSFDDIDTNLIDAVVAAARTGRPCIYDKLMGPFRQTREEVSAGGVRRCRHVVFDLFS